MQLNVTSGYMMLTKKKNNDEQTGISVIDTVMVIDIDMVIDIVMVIDTVIFQAILEMLLLSAELSGHKHTVLPAKIYHLIFGSFSTGTSWCYHITRGNVCYENNMTISFLSYHCRSSSTWLKSLVAIKPFMSADQ